MDTGSDNWHSRTHRKTELLLFQSHPAITAYDDHTLLIGIDGGGVHTVNLETKRSIFLSIQKITAISTCKEMEFMP